MWPRSSCLNAQLLVVSAAYSRPSDIEYDLYNKEFMNVYMNLKSRRSSRQAGVRRGRDARRPGGAARQESRARLGAPRADADVFDGDFADPEAESEEDLAGRLLQGVRDGRRASTPSCSAFSSTS